MKSKPQEEDNPMVSLLVCLSVRLWTCQAKPAQCHCNSEARLPVPGAKD